MQNGPTTTYALEDNGGRVNRFEQTLLLQYPGLHLPYTEVLCHDVNVCLRALRIQSDDQLPAINSCVKHTPEQPNITQVRSPSCKSVQKSAHVATNKKPLHGSTAQRSSHGGEPPTGPNNHKQVFAIQELTAEKQRKQSLISLDTRPPPAKCRSGGTKHVQARAFSILLRLNNGQRTKPHGKVALEAPAGGNGIYATNDFP
jgi:hypothetical protein